MFRTYRILTIYIYTLYTMCRTKALEHHNQIDSMANAIVKIESEIKKKRSKRQQKHFR